MAVISLNGWRRGWRGGAIMAVMAAVAIIQLPSADGSPLSNACTSDQFTCANGRCFPGRIKCDGDNDCGDNSDEEGCNSDACTSDQFTCPNGRCFPGNFKCDGDNDCGDNSDEKGCSDTCQSDQFRCPSGFCIPGHFKCAGHNDCRDLCPDACTSHQFTCANRLCIPGHLKCDGDNDCGDNSDEEGCNSERPVHMPHRSLHPRPLQV